MAAAKKVPPQLTRLCARLRGLNANGRLAVCCFWLRHSHGAATRYLDNHLGWQWAIDMGRIANSERFLRAALGHFGR
jgi:hypothetical protein